MHEILAAASWMAECPLLSVCLGFFPSMSWLPWLLFILSMMLQWAVQGKEKASKLHNLGCHPAVILCGSWGNVALECSCTLKVSWGPETSPGVCSVSVHPQSSVILSSLLPLPLQIRNCSAEVKGTKSVLSEKRFKIGPLDFELIKITKPKCALGFF